MDRKRSWEDLPLPEHNHIKILDRGELWKVDNNVALIFKAAECHFKRITSVPTTKIDCKNIVPTLMKNLFIHESMSKIRSKSTDTIIKKEIALNLLEDLLILYIRVRTFYFAKDQIRSHKIKQSRLKSRPLRTSLKKMGFKNWRVTNHKNSYFYSYKYLKNKNDSFFLLFLFSCFSFNHNQKQKKQETLFWSVFLVYLLFLKTRKLLNSIAGHNKRKQNK